MKNSIRDRLVQLNHDFSQLDIAGLCMQTSAMSDELHKFCSSTEICSSTWDQMLETDVELKASCENLCRLFALHGFYVEMRSARICAADKKQNLDEHFKHRRSYEQLIQSEVNMLQALGVHLSESSANSQKSGLLVTKIAFIGSGAIPTSSVIILNNHGPLVDIYNIDMCEEANLLASVIAQRLLPSHLSEHMHFITQDIRENPLREEVRSILNQCQLIYLAAYVGGTELEKLEILRNLVNQSTDKLSGKIEQYFVIRTAEGLYEVLFPKVKAEKIALLQRNSNEDMGEQFLFQIKTVQQSLANYGMVSIIAESISNIDY